MSKWKAFWKGFWSILDLFPEPVSLSKRHKLPKLPKLTEEEALAKDWEKVAGDFCRAFKKVTK